MRTVTPRTTPTHLRPLLRLAWRDTRQHLTRTLLMLTLVGLPLAACLLMLSNLTPVASKHEQVLALLPKDSQASILASTLPTPVQQVPEAFPFGFRDMSITPATPDAIGAALPPGTELHEWWNSPTLVATTALDIPTGTTEEASAATLVKDVKATELAKVHMREANSETLSMLIPTISEGRAPRTSSEIVVSRRTAERTHVSVGENVQLIAPPDTGWFGTDGRVGSAVQNSVRAYEVVGIVDPPETDEARVDEIHGGNGEGGDELAWALPGWISSSIEKQQTGVDRHFLATGPSPITWDAIKDLNTLGVGVISRDPLVNYPPQSALYPVRVDPQAVALQITLVTLTAVGSVLLMVTLITPALTVGAARMRRHSALVVAAGARMREAASVHLLSGLTVGIVGSVLGIGSALLALPVLRALTPAPHWGDVPVWVIVALLLLGITVPTIAAIPAAISTGRRSPIDALEDRPSDAHTRHPMLSRALTGTAILLSVVGALLAVGGSFLPAQLSLFAVIVGLLFLTIGMVLLTPTLLRTLPPLLRFLPRAVLVHAAARDACRALSRSVPAVCTVMVCMMGVSIVAVLAGTTQANSERVNTSMVAPGMFTIGMDTPINNDVDQRIIHSVLTQLKSEGRVKDFADVYSLGGGNIVEARYRDGFTCPPEDGVSVMSATDPNTPPECVPIELAYNPGLKFPTWVGKQVAVLSPEAMRLTHLPGADNAARVLENGGVVVNNATQISDDQTVNLALLDPDNNGPQRDLGTHPGLFLRGFEPYVTITPEMATEWGFSPRYVGVIVVPSEPIDGPGLDAWSTHIAQITSTVWMAGNPRSDALGFINYQYGLPLAEALLFALTILTALASGVALALGQVEAESDTRIMHRIGASPRQLRGYAMAQAVVIVGTGIPLGTVLGLVSSLAVIQALRKAEFADPFADIQVLPFAWLFSVGIVVLSTLLVAAVLSGRVVQRRAAAPVPPGPPSPQVPPVPPGEAASSHIAPQ